MTDNTSDNSDTDNANQNNDQATSKTYSQEEFDTAMAGARRSAESKWQKKIDNLGGYDVLQELVTQAEKSEEKKAREKGQWEQIVTKKDEKIQTLSKEIEEFKISNPLLNAAAKHRAVSPEQVVALTKSNVKLNDTGDVVIVDAAGNTQLTDDGNAVGIDQFVEQFLTDNPHMVTAGKSSSASNSSHVNNTSTEIDLSKLDNSNPEHRAIYEKYLRNRSLG
jgi:hypothetical protein